MIVYEYKGNPEIGNISNPPMTIAMIMYNRKEYVKDAVESLLKQDYPNLEIVISDDNSNDGATEIALDLVKAYKGRHRIVVNVNERNLGLGGNFAKALALSRGEWVVACGGDDVQHNDRVSQVLRYAREYPSAVIIGSGANTVDSRGVMNGEWGVTDPFLYKKYHEGDLQFASGNTADKNATMSVACGATAAYRKDLCELFPFPNDVWCEDLVMDLRGIQFGDILLIPEKLVDYRVHNQSVSYRRENVTGREARRKLRNKGASNVYVSYKGALGEAFRLQAGDVNGFVSTLCYETARWLLWCFKEGDASERVSLYVSAYKIARKRFSFLTLMRGAEGRGVLWCFLTVAFRAFFCRDRGCGNFMKKLGIAVVNQKGGL